MQRRRAAAQGLESSYRRHGGEEAAYADDVRCLHGLVRCCVVYLLDVMLAMSLPLRCSLFFANLNSISGVLIPPSSASLP